VKKIILAVAVAAVATVGVASSATAGGGTGITATPAAPETWAGHSATFVRSASGIITETNRVNLDPAGPQNPWTSADVYLQFRPKTGPNGTGSPTPNPACDPNGLVTETFPFVNNPADTSIGGTPTTGYFIGSNPYNVCVYLVNPQVASGTIDSAALNGSTATLPTGLDGKQFRINVSGTYANSNLNVADAEYTNTSIDNWVTHQDGYDIDPWFLGAGFGDVQVNGSFVNWGAFSASHEYGLSTTLNGFVNLAVFDGDSDTDPNTKDPAWYGDNVGTLNYTVTYLGL
jgi:hypothetical protein